MLLLFFIYMLVQYSVHLITAMCNVSYSVYYLSVMYNIYIYINLIVCFSLVICSFLLFYIVHIGAQRNTISFSCAQTVSSLNDEVHFDFVTLIPQHTLKVGHM